MRTSRALLIALIALLLVGLHTTTARAVDWGKYQPDWEAYCQSHGLGTARDVGDTAYDIKCIDKNGNQHEINVPQLCREQNGNDPNTTYWLDQSKFTGGYVRDAWRCIGLANLGQGPIGDLTGVMERYCASFSAEGLTLAGKTINDWYCVKNGARSGDPVNMDSACDWQYGDGIGDSIATWYWYDPYSAKCWM